MAPAVVTSMMSINLEGVRLELSTTAAAAIALLFIGVFGVASSCSFTDYKIRCFLSLHREHHAGDIGFFCPSVPTVECLVFPSTCTFNIL